MGISPQGLSCRVALFALDKAACKSLGTEQHRG
jgi:hypothetical protein